MDCRNILTFEEACELFPKEWNVTPFVLTRWTKKGERGIYLSYIHITNKRKGVRREQIEAFLTALSVDQDKENKMLDRLKEGIGQSGSSEDLYNAHFKRGKV